MSSDKIDIRDLFANQVLATPPEGRSKIMMALLLCYYDHLLVSSPDMDFQGRVERTFDLLIEVETRMARMPLATTPPAGHA
jgi:hypothetical protein